MASLQSLGSLVRVFPALWELGSRLRARRIPLVLQMEDANSGAACLAMVLGYHGKWVRLEELREATGTDRDGVNALSILEAGRAHGLQGRGVKVNDPRDLKYLPVPAILHFEWTFVVFGGLRRNSVKILDPAVGERRVPMDEFRKRFSGVALTLVPGDDFEPRRRRDKGSSEADHHG